MDNRDKMLSIGEVAQTINITRRMILNYEQRGLITPDIKDGKLGNRYYSVDSMTRIRTIRIFQDMGLSLDEIAAYLNGTAELETLIKRLEILRDEINLNIEKLRARANPKYEWQIERVMLPAQYIYKKVCFSETVEEKKEIIRAVLLEAIKLYGTDITKRMFFTEHHYSAPKEVSYCIAVPEGSTGEYIVRLEESAALRITLHGGYGELPKLQKLILQRAEEDNIPLTGICRHTYLEGPPQHQNESRFITNVDMIIRDQ